MSSSSLSNIVINPTTSKNTALSKESSFQTVLPSLILSTKYPKTPTDSAAGPVDCVILYVKIKLNGVHLKLEEWIESGLINKIKSYIELVLSSFAEKERLCIDSVGKIVTDGEDDETITMTIYLSYESNLLPNEDRLSSLTIIFSFNLPASASINTLHSQLHSHPIHFSLSDLIEKGLTRWFKTISTKWKNMFNQKWNKRVQQDKVWYNDIAKSLESILMGSGDAEMVLQFKLYESKLRAIVQHTDTSTDEEEEEDIMETKQVIERALAESVQSVLSPDQFVSIASSTNKKESKRNNRGAEEGEELIDFDISSTPTQVEMSQSHDFDEFESLGHDSEQLQLDKEQVEGDFDDDENIFSDEDDSPPLSLCDEEDNQDDGNEADSMNEDDLIDLLDQIM